MGFLIGRLMVGLLLCVGAAAAQSQLKEGTGSIAGRVTLGGKPAQGVILTLRESSNDERRALSMLMKGSAFEKATTDGEGRYRFTGLAKGVYEVAAFAPALYAGDDKSESVTLGDGATVDDIDFSLSKGCVITGRVTAADGRPVIMEPVQASRLDQSDTKSPFGFSFNLSTFATDERGVYRIYGLPPGRYRVAVGKNPLSGAMGLALKRPDHPRTFHPGVTDEARAVVIELTAGGEASNIDIKLGDANKTYKASGRVMDAETKKPIPNALTSYRTIKSQSGDSQNSGMGVPTSSTGEFRLESLTPGQYVAYALFGVGGASDFYSEAVNFEVRNEDISGLEIKAHRGSSISGLVVIEGTSDPAVLNRLAQIELYARVYDPARLEGSTAPNMVSASVSSDGSFQMRGLRPGRAQFTIHDPAGQFRVKRFERIGAEQSPGLEVDIAAGDQISDLRVVVVFAAGVIQGQVNIEGGTLPKGARLFVDARRSDPSAIDDGHERADVGQGGNFMIEGLTPGEYEVTLTALLNPGAPASVRQVRLVRQKVVVMGDSPTEMVLVLDLAKTSERD